MPSDTTYTSPRLLRITDVLAPNGPIPVSKSTWWEGVRNGRYPKPIKLSPKITVWRSDEINQLVQKGTPEDVAKSPCRGQPARRTAIGNGLVIRGRAPRCTETRR